MDDLYNFVFRGQLAEASLDKVGRVRNRFLLADEFREISQSLCIDLLDRDLLADSQRMAIVYTAIHTFENMIRHFVMKAMAEKYGETWWKEVPDRIKKKVVTRSEEDAKFKWHGNRGTTEIYYCDFGDLSSVIVTNWEVFEDVLAKLEWSKQLLGTLEKSRNIVMHGGILGKEDIERIGMNIRDWVRQAG